MRVTQPADKSVVQPRNGLVRVAWAADVAPAGAALSSVLHSSDGGKTWSDRAFEVKAASFDVMLEPGVKAHQVKIVVTDGTPSAAQVLRFTTR